ncbi:hypothetical protein GZ78_04040 [Endozoicomonas numazuensis]|uniref:Protease n=1 Tax=Endozoicomonas numazuensis TaxID=1137799 RepID=A0A081NL51_9GAMM|nr:hypothetical protein GZ78_04040 [Endozoicomonas numazuensis]
MGLGILSGELNLSPDADGWAQLLPAGHFSAVDGRPFDVPGGQWFLDGEIADRLINQVRGLTNDRLIDYEHQTLKAEENGQPAIASGWFNADEMEWREGEGLYIKPRWTDKARDYIQSDEYRFLSAVFPYDKTTGAPVALKMAALVNYPGLDGLQKVSALKGQFQKNHKETAMEQWLKDLLARIGIEVSEDTVSTEQGQAALSAVKALKTKADSADTLTTEVAALKASAKTEGVNLSQYVPKAMYDDAVVEIASLKGSSAEQTVDQLVSDALKEGRAFKREEDYLKQFGNQQGEAALKAMLESRAPVAALKGKQTDELPDPKKQKNQDLNTDELAVLKATGISKEEFLKQRAAE